MIGILKMTKRLTLVVLIKKAIEILTNLNLCQVQEKVTS